MSWTVSRLTVTMVAAASGGERLTLDDLVVGKVQVEQEEHVQHRYSPTEEEARSPAHCAGQQSRHLTGSTNT